MNIDEFLQDLYNDELSDMFIGNRNDKEEARPKLLPLMNKAMLQAYAKYNVKFTTVALATNATEQTYLMVEEDILAIMAVIDAEGRELKPHEVKVLGQTLLFACPKEAQYTVRYKVKPTRFIEAQEDEDVELELPDLLVSWMSCWVAARTFLSRKDDTSIAKGVELMTLAGNFEEAFQSTNTTNEYTNPDNSKLQARGFC
jgi:hypothetical protein